LAGSLRCYPPWVDGAAGIEEPSIDVEEIRRCALRGARSVTSRRQVVEDACDVAVQQWENAVLSRKAVEDWCAWVFRVGANAARRLAGCRQAGRAATNLDVVLESAASWVESAGDAPLPAVDRAELREFVLGNKARFVGRQWEVLMKLTEGGVSVHRASRELGMDRKSLRRSFRTALKRIRR